VRSFRMQVGSVTLKVPDCVPSLGVGRRVARCAERVAADPSTAGGATATDDGIIPGARSSPGCLFAVSQGRLATERTMPRVLTVCPTTADTVATEAEMTEEAFKRLKVGMAIYCAACSRPHLAERRHLWLETADYSLGQPPPDEIAGDLRSDQSPKDRFAGRGLGL
jgi:hypothetical protein